MIKQFWNLLRKTLSMVSKAPYYSTSLGHLL